jgi:hypothetical protein
MNKRKVNVLKLVVVPDLDVVDADVQVALGLDKGGLKELLCFGWGVRNSALLHFVYYVLSF